MNTKPKTIALSPVKSSQIAAIGHDPMTNTLAIQFSPKKDGTPGSVYHYANVSADQFNAFKSADSIGSHFGKVFKHNTKDFPFTKQTKPHA